MSKVKKVIQVIVGKYTNSAGENKNIYKTIGKIIDTNTGDRLVMECTPIIKGGWDGWAFINDPLPKHANAGFPSDGPEDDDFKY